MKSPIVFFAVLTACLGAALLGVRADEPANMPTQAPAVSLQSARAMGREKSRLLKVHAAHEPPASRAPTADVAFFEKSVKATLAKSCSACHGPKRAEGRLRVDQLDPNLLTGESVNQWREIYNVLSNSEMPPEDEPDYALADADRGRIVDWLSAELNKASLVRRQDKQHSSFRRLTRYEYEYALQDLLNIPYGLANNLPPESTSEDGFKNSSELLQMSAQQLVAYREIGLKALQRTIVPAERPKPVVYLISMAEEFQKTIANPKTKTFELGDDSYRNNSRRTHLLDRESGKGAPLARGPSKPQPTDVLGPATDASPIALALPRNNELKINLDRFLPDEGVMRVRIRASRSTMHPDEFASLRLIFSAHTSNNANFSQVISKHDVPVTASADDPEFIDFFIQLGDIQRNPFRKLKTTFPRRDEFLHIRNISNSGGRDEPFHVLIDHIEISAPFYAQWPPKPHRDIFFDSEHRDNEEKYGRDVLARFLNRVWRRPATSAEVDQFIKLFKDYRPDFDRFEDAMLEVLATALASPEFLYVTQRAAAKHETTDPGPTDPIDPFETAPVARVSDLELASRLSIFLWSSVPDNELLSLATQGKLHDSGVLTSQIQRMLADPRSRRFSRHFVQQWLGLDGLDSVPHLTDESLKEAMAEEPIAFFEEVLGKNRSIMDFLHSDYVVVNERLASHYRIPKVYGPHFRKTPVDPGRHRGGVLTSAAILAMNSDGKDSHPLKRGVWMLERILHDPPPPPPPNVPEVDLTDPNILKMTLKERIADHRNKAACSSCHSRIDPWGIAFENYDAMGVFRTHIKNKPVDAASELFNKQTLDGMDGLKRYLLLERQDQFARAIVHKMTAYALGRPVAFSDRVEIDRLTTKFRQQGDRLGDLVQLIVLSDVFQSK